VKSSFEEAIAKGKICFFEVRRLGELRRKLWIVNDCVPIRVQIGKVKKKRAELTLEREGKADQWAIVIRGI